MSYTVSKEDGVTIVRGKIPIGDMVALMNAHNECLSEEAIADGFLASHLGACAVWGELEACKKLRKKYNIDWGGDEG